jgi:hypothetical protein
MVVLTSMPRVASLSAPYFASSSLRTESTASGATLGNAEPSGITAMGAAAIFLATSS